MRPAAATFYRILNETKHRTKRGERAISFEKRPALEAVARLGVNVIVKGSHGSCSDRRLSLPLQARADGPARWAYSDEAGLPRGELGRSSRVSSRCRTRTRTRTRIPRCGGGCCGPRPLPRGAPHARGQREESTRTRRSATTRLATAHAASRTHAAHAKTGTAGALETEVHAGCWALALGRDVAHAAARERRARHAGEGARARRRRAPRNTHIRVL